MASAVDSRLAYARLSAVATASRLPTATRGSNNSYTTSWDTTGERIQILELLRRKRKQAKDGEGEELSVAEEETWQKYRKNYPGVRVAYQKWYATAFRVVRRLAPERLPEFERLYAGEPRRKTLSPLTAGIIDYLYGLTSRDGLEWRDYSGTFYSHSDTEIAILLAIHDNLGHVLFELDAQLEHGVFTSELEQADLLKNNGHIRAAGAVAGVAVEGHLSGACKRKGIKLRKAKPTIADYNDALKADGHIETPTWRLIQRLADIRTYCVHKKEREPTEDEVLDLIRGAHKVLADIA